MTTAGVFCGVFALSLSGPTSLTGQEYHVDLDSEREVVFYSQAPIEDFEGVTDRIDGYLLLDGEGVRADSGNLGELYFEVDLASLDTGIGLRNRHMRENYLETERYPWATYEGQLREISAAGSRRWTAGAVGTFTVHGVERELAVECPVEADGRGYRVECEFRTLLSEHDIEIPKVMFLKLADEIRIRVRFRLRPAPSSGDTP